GGARRRQPAAQRRRGVPPRHHGAGARRRRGARRGGAGGGPRRGRGGRARGRAVRAVLHHQGRGNRPRPGHRARQRARAGRGRGLRPRRRRHALVPVGAARRGGGVTTVLVVEDEPGLREGLVAAVETLGYRALPAAGLGDARRLLGTEGVDCVLLDIRLRDGDGLDLLREMRAGAQREVPVIVATAYGDSERTIGAMRDGAFDYLTKPFDFPELLATVERAIKQRALAQSIASPAPEPRPP